MENLQVQIKVSNLMYSENWVIDEEEVQSIDSAIDWLKENLEFKSEIDGFTITEKNFNLNSLEFDDNTCTIIKTEYSERCIYLKIA